MNNQQQPTYTWLQIFFILLQTLFYYVMSGLVMSGAILFGYVIGNIARQQQGQPPIENFVGLSFISGFGAITLAFIWMYFSNKKRLRGG
jgi:uncharacterized BrkB/YihY/UPF0761 family membrane protein